MKYFYITLRILLGLLFIFSGYVKGVDPWGTVIKFDEYFEAMGLRLPHFLSTIFANLLNILELLVGYLLVFNLQMKWASRTATLLMMLFTPLTLWLAVTNKVKDCGCFGDAIKVTDWETFGKNIVLIVIAVFVLRYAAKFPSKIPLKKQRLLFIIGILFSSGITYFSYQHLPIIDFRPFKIGSNIEQGIAIPEDAPTDEYQTTLKYEKDGQIKAFTQENFPWQDTTWHFVSSEQVLIKKGYSPPIQDFYIETIKGENVTESILNSKSCLLIVSYKVEKTNFVRNYQESYLKETVQAANKQNIPVYLLTASIPAQVENIRTYIHENVVWCFADEKMLKTMIRANPGVVLLNNGIVAAKWNSDDLPKKFKFEVPAIKEHAEQTKQTVYNRQIYFSLLLFAVLTIITLVLLKINKQPKKQEDKNKEITT